MSEARIGIACSVQVCINQLCAAFAWEKKYIDWHWHRGSRGTGYFHRWRRNILYRNTKPREWIHINGFYSKCKMFTMQWYPNKRVWVMVNIFSRIRHITWFMKEHRVSTLWPCINRTAPNSVTETSIIKKCYTTSVRPRSHAGVEKQTFIESFLNKSHIW